jgi:hypothetical protein
MKNIHFSCRLLKIDDTKNESLFLVTVEIISWHHKKILSVTINRFSSSVEAGENLGRTWY